MADQQAEHEGVVTPIAPPRSGRGAVTLPIACSGVLTAAIMQVAHWIPFVDLTNNMTFMVVSSTTAVASALVIAIAREASIRWQRYKQLKDLQHKTRLLEEHQRHEILKRWGQAVVDEIAMTARSRVEAQLAEQKHLTKRKPRRQASTARKKPPSREAP